MTDALITQAYLEALAAGSPDGRVTQAYLEALAAGSPDADVTQAYLEVLTPSALTYSDLSQVYAEALTVAAAPPADVTQVYLEALSPTGVPVLSGLTVEIFVNSTWIDISSFVYYKNRIRISRGKPNEASQIQSQTATFTINNRDGRFSPRNPLSPYYGLIGRNTPVRIYRVQNGTRRYRFWGEVPSWPTAYDISGTDVYVNIAASGPMRRLFQGNQPLHSALYRAWALGFALGSRPVAYWPCEDGTNSTQIAPGLAGVSPLALSGQALPTFATDTTIPGSTPLPLLSGSVWTGQIPAYTGGDTNNLLFMLSIPKTGAFDTAVLVRLHTTGTGARWDLQYGAASNGSLSLTVYDAAGAQLFTTGYVSRFNGFNGMPVMISMTQTPLSGGTSTVYEVNFVRVGTANIGYGLLLQAMAGHIVGPATGFVINPDGHIDDTAIGHVTYHKFYGSGIGWQLNAWITEAPLVASTSATGTSRFLRLCQEQNVPAVAILASGINAGDATTMGYQLNDTFTNLIQEPANSSGSLLFEARDQNALVMRERGTLYNQAAKLTLDHSQHQLSGPLNPVDDDALTRNDVTVERVNGSSNQQVLTSGTLSTAPPPAGVGDYPTTYSLSLGSDTLLADQAGWRLHLGTVDQPRYPSIMINLRHPTFTGDLSLMNAALTIDIGDRLVITNPQTQLGTDPISQIVQGYSETLGAWEHDIVFNCSPEDPYHVAVLEDTILGRADTDGSTLVADISSTALTFQVARTNASSPLWTTAGGDFPLDIAMGGERITISAISGASSPQTFTASARSVNGIAKAQTATTDIRLWQPMTLSL